MSGAQDWRKVAWDLFGYALLSERNVIEVSVALAQISELLNDHREVQITVRERVEDADVIDGELSSNHAVREDKPSSLADRREITLACPNG